MQTINVRLVHSTGKTEFFVNKIRLAGIEQKDGEFLVSLKWSSMMISKNDYVDAIEFVSDRICKAFMYLGVGVNFC